MDKSRYRSLFVEEARRVIGNGDTLVADQDALGASATHLLRCFHTLKGMSATMDYAAVTLLAHALEDVCDALHQGRIVADGAVAVLLAAGLDTLRRQVDTVEAGAEPEPSYEMERQIREHLQSGGTTGFRLLVPSMEADPATDEEDEAPRTEDAVGAIGEILATAGRLRELAQDGEAMSKEIGRLEIAARGLYARLVELRQVPFGSAMPPLRRHLRALCREHARDASLESLGEDLLVDPDVLAPLQGVLAQLLNNAVVHGIEDEAERRAHNKPPGGRITLRAERVGSNVVILFADDGRGLDTERLRRAAGTDGDPVSLATTAGVSTAERVDHHAGRGQGLTTVLNAVDRLGGRTEISSRPGRGVRVHIEMPLRTDLEEVLLVEAERQTFALLARHARVEPGEHPDAPPLLGMNVEGRAGIVARGSAPTRVDRVIGVVSAVVRPAPFPFSLLRSIAGTTVAPDGRILFVLDPGAPDVKPDAAADPTPREAVPEGGA